MNKNYKVTDVILSEELTHEQVKHLQDKKIKFANDISEFEHLIEPVIEEEISMMGVVE